jgi:hypothetical protein
MSMSRLQDKLRAITRGADVTVTSEDPLRVQVVSWGTTHMIKRDANGRAFATPDGSTSPVVKAVVGYLNGEVPLSLIRSGGPVREIE